MNEMIDRAAKAILSTRAPGLGRAQWARLAAKAVIETIGADLPKAPPPQRRSGAETRGTRDAPVIHVRERQCGGWIGTFDDGSLRFGVTEPTEAETRASLEVSEKRWRTILSTTAEDPAVSGQPTEA